MPVQSFQGADDESATEKIEVQLDKAQQCYQAQIRWIDEMFRLGFNNPFQDNINNLYRNLIIGIFYEIYNGPISILLSNDIEKHLKFVENYDDNWYDELALTISRIEGVYVNKNMELSNGNCLSSEFNETENAIALRFVNDLRNKIVFLKNYRNEIETQIGLVYQIREDYIDEGMIPSYDDGTNSNLNLKTKHKVKNKNKMLAKITSKLTVGQILNFEDDDLEEFYEIMDNEFRVVDPTDGVMTQFIKDLVTGLNIGSVMFKYYFALKETVIENNGNGINYLIELIGNQNIPIRERASEIIELLSINNIDEISPFLKTLSDNYFTIENSFLSKYPEGNREDYAQLFYTTYFKQTMTLITFFNQIADTYKETINLADSLTEANKCCTKLNLLRNNYDELVDFINEINRQNSTTFLVSSKIEPPQLGIKEEYSKYIELYGMPENMEFDKEKLLRIIHDMKNENNS